MQYRKLLIRSVGISALLIATPSLAQSRIDRARTAVAEATAKVEAAENVGAARFATDALARAQESLRTARDQLQRDHRDSAINEARRASGLADAALAQAESNKRGAVSAERNARVNAQADAAVQANERVAAEDAAAAANARADEATRAAQASAAEAAAARAAAAATPPAPAPVTTTVTTVDRTTSAAATRSYSRVKKPVRRVVHKAPVRAKATTTTRTTTIQTKTN